MNETFESSAGLSSLEVQERQKQGQSNAVDNATSRSLADIIRANVFTVFNAILTAAVVAVLIVGDWRDTVFALVMISNLAIGVFSELRSKRTLDSLAVLNKPTSIVLRDGQHVEIPNDDLVIDDVIELKLGDQIPADGQIIRSQGLQVDESALTGESRSVRKYPGDATLSGTSIIAGSGAMVVEAIGEDSWAQKITAEAKKFSKVQSEIQRAIDQILRWITWALPLIIILLFWSQLRTEDANWRTAIVYTVAGVVGMIPQGLVLLTSMNFGIAAATLARRGVLVQELPAVEILARVDVLCLDKTGTLTTGAIRGRELVVSPDIASEKEQIEYSKSVLSTLVADATNATSVAAASLVTACEKLPVDDDWLLPFNSMRKWSALSLPDTYAVEPGTKGFLNAPRTWVFGAPEVLLDGSGVQNDWARQRVAKESAKGRRTIVLACSSNPLIGEDLPKCLNAVFVLVLEEDIRPDAGETLSYFKKQGVRVKVISGDAPETVGAIAADVGLRGADGADPHVVDARTLPPIGDPAFVAAALDTDVFGRVTPEQKQALVKSLQAEGHTVAMTGDGVNDALALKHADLGIAMGNGAPATKAVARLVLVDGQFSVLPGIVAEGRRIIANMERVSSLFLSKTTYAILIALFVGAFGIEYPFLPRHLTDIGAFTIGIPAFFLALAPNARRYRPGFLKRTLLIAVPAGIALGSASLVAYSIAGEEGPLGNTAATLSVIIGAMALLIVLARPWNPLKVALVVTMIAGATMGLVVAPIRDFFALEWPTPEIWALIVIAGLCAASVIVVSYVLTGKSRAEGRNE